MKFRQPASDWNERDGEEKEGGNFRNGEKDTIGKEKLGQSAGDWKEIKKEGKLTRKGRGSMNEND